jgi:hypothetical protein
MRYLIAAAALLAITAVFALAAYAAPDVTLQPGESITIRGAVTGGTPTVPPIVTPPTGWNGVCAGFSATRVATATWGANARIHPSAYGGMAANDALVIKFVTGAESTTTNLAKIAAAEWGTTPSERLAVLSETPCDFTGDSAVWGSKAQGNSVTIPFAVGAGGGFGFYKVLKLNTTYYFNIRNTANASCGVQGSCDVFVDLLTYGLR